MEKVNNAQEEMNMIPEPAVFAQEWINAWNSHDLDRILNHYS
ncbi:MAG: nuclear transport factor 2 family protein [Nitrospirota bacterium]